jgi:hypothetical protein
MLTPSLGTRTTTRKKSMLSASLAASLLFLPRPVAPGTGPSLTVVSPVNDNEELKSMLSGPGITITSLIVRCQSPQQVGLFAGGEYDLGIETGVVISSAFAVTAEGPNENSYGVKKQDSVGGAGNPYLDELLEDGDRFTKDACALDIKFTCQDPSKFEFTFVFGSDDYPSNGSVDQEDLMAAYLNGVEPYNNVATLAGDYISVNTVPSGSSLLRNNQNGAYDVEMNAFTKVVTAKAAAAFGTNRLLIVVSDGGKTGSNTRPSWVFLEKGSLKCSSSTSPIPGSIPVGSVKFSAAECATTIVKTQCRCGDWQCIDAHVRTVCRTTKPMSEADFLFYLREVRKAFRDSKFKRVFC